MSLLSRHGSSSAPVWIALLGAALVASCDSPQHRALGELTQHSVEPSGRSLITAVEQGDNRVTALLLEAGVYTEQRNPGGLTPLGVAVRNSNRTLVCMLLNAGARVDARQTGQASLLGIAAQRGDAVMVNILLASGARSDGLMPDGEKILPWAIREGRLDLVRQLMAGESDPHLKDRLGNPLLHIAMEAGRRDLTQTLIELGADPGAINANRETTIHLALRKGWVDLIPQLANAGADPNAPGPDGVRPLEKAAMQGDMDQVAMFLKIGANPHLTLRDGNTTLFREAFDNPRPLLFRTLLDHGTRPPAENGWSPWLAKACRKRDFAKARLMLSHGGLADATPPPSVSLPESAVLRGDATCLKLLLDYGIRPGRALHFACLKGNHDMASILLASGASPNVNYFPTRDSLLAIALRGRQDRLAELLIQYGADIHSVLPEGQSAFHLAVATGCSRTVAQLLARGADSNAPFRLPVSPAFLKCVRPGVMRWVLKMDRNVTPLMTAADSGNVETARLLIRAGAKTGVHTKIASLWPINFASRRGDVAMMRLFLGRNPLREERRIEIHLSEQKARMFDANGKEIFATRVSTGRKGFDTPTGVYVITNKHRDWTSTLYHASMPFFQRLSCGDFGLHQGNVPGYPASHGCIRVPAGNAEKLFSMTQTGDRVCILP